jgi:DNA polymerase-3 subunit epsilon
LIFAVVDIETNGGRPGPGTITEIAVRISDGSSLLHSREWLIRPEMPVPFHITALTGIDNDMLREAPSFAEVAEEVLCMLHGHVFTAHNASFDLSHLKAAFEACGLTFKPRVICTVRSARKCWPGLKSYSLGNLCAALDIPILNRHRAGGDADATVLLLHKMAALPDPEKLFSGTSKRNKINLPAGLDINDIPETTGVYRFLNAAGKVLYVGKAMNLRKRVLQHFYKGGGGQNLLQEVADIKTITCGNELMALIAESAAIRQYWPPYNKAARFKARPCCLVCYNNQEGMPMLALSGQQGENRALLRFSGMAEARNALAQMLKEFGVCKALNHNTRATCTQEDCYCGAGKLQKKQIHLERMTLLLQQLSQPPEKYLLKGLGRSPEEYACVWVEQSRIMAYGYLPQGAWPFPERLEQELTPLEDHPSLRAIAAAFTARAQMQHTPYQLVSFPIN